MQCQCAILDLNQKEENPNQLENIEQNNAENRMQYSEAETETEAFPMVSPFKSIQKYALLIWLQSVYGISYALPCNRHILDYTSHTFHYALRTFVRSSSLEPK